ncbi:Nitrogen regulatory protein PII [Dillenia turbinata]|uniref:Nitrogen regulatory protein PII n=1 Tax=Dillenia turbinata TaxID=194707 RepID=A0AAN8ZE25_9MAGN
MLLTNRTLPFPPLSLTYLMLEREAVIKTGRITDKFCRRQNWKKKSTSRPFQVSAHEPKSPLHFASPNSRLSTMTTVAKPSSVPRLLASRDHEFPVLESNSLIPKPRNSSFLKSGVRLTQSRTPSYFPAIKAQSSPDDGYVPDSKFYKVEAILRPWRIPQVSSALLKMGIRGVTVSDVRGFGAQGGSAERHGGSEFLEDKFVAEVKMEIVVSKDQVEAVIEMIIKEARTGEIGDGKIFLVPVSDVIRIRTGERGEKAERMTGGRYDMFSASSLP